MKYLKYIFVLMIILLIVMIPLSVNSAQINPNSYNPGEVKTSETKEVSKIASTVLAYIRNFGIISSVVILTIIGLKYMISSVQEKAEYKQNMILYIAGCFILMMVTTIPSIVYEIMK